MGESGVINRTEPKIEAVAELKGERVVRIAQFLPKHQRDALYDAMCENQDAFKHPGMPECYVDSSLYLSPDIEHLDHAQIEPIRTAYAVLKQRIREQLPSLFNALDIEPFPVSELRITLLNGLDGHCGSPHADDSGGGYKMSLLYYIHRTPKAFSGGDLVFYDTDSPSLNSTPPVATIEHEDNLLLAFSSYVFHSITEVHSESAAFADGRFVAIVFLGPQ